MDMTQQASHSVDLFSHLAALIAYAALAIALGARRAPSGFRLSVMLAASMTALWAGVATFEALTNSPPLWLNQLGTLRTAAWVAVLLVLQRRSLGLADKPTSSFIIAAGLGFVIALLLALDLGIQISAKDSTSLLLLFTTGRMILAISGIVLLHNLYANSSGAALANFRLLAVGLAIIFVYDLNFYTLQFLSGHPSLVLHDLRGAIFVLAAPLIYLGMRADRDGRFSLSHRAAFNTVSFTLIGMYLIFMSILSYGVRLTGGNWGEVLQIGFLAIAMVTGGLVVLSPRFRADMRVRIARNFYRYRYDYREEWLRFIDQIDAGHEVSAPFRERLIEAIATVVDCPGGALLEPDGNRQFQIATRWYWDTMPDIPPLSADGEVISYLTSTGRVIEFDRLRAERADQARPGSHGSLSLPLWAANKGIWLAIPLVHREQLRGIILLERSLAPHSLNWEDFDLLRTLGRQGASYLAEADTQAQLEEARSFDEYNRRFAFVMHDVKNVVSQLALVARNAERHADKPEFRADMIITLKSSVTKMTDLLNLMGKDNKRHDGEDAETTIDLAEMLATAVAALRRQHSTIELTGIDQPAHVTGNRTRLEAMLTHLIQNAIDASPTGTPVHIWLGRDEGHVDGAHFVIRVKDHGQGMSDAFIRDDLFKPFRSTKEGGFGIGAFEAREIAHAHGGQLMVESSPGDGTVFTIRLPAISLAETGNRPGTNMKSSRT